MAAKVLCAAQQLMSFNKPANGDYRSVETYIHNNKPLVEDEGSYIYRKEDMVTLRAGREHAWLDTWVEKLLKAINCKAIEVREINVIPFLMWITYLAPVHILLKRNPQQIAWD